MALAFYVDVSVCDQITMLITVLISESFSEK